MSRLTRIVVRIAARALPQGVHERHREEWLGDLESAAAEGLSDSGIAVGAVLFSATLNRDAPEISGVPLTVTTRRRARWGVALLSASAVLGISFWINGGFSGSGNVEGFAGAILTPVNLVTPVLAIGLASIGLVFLWRAAIPASALAKISAILATMMVAILFVPLPGGIPFFVAAALGFAAGICGLVAWASAPAVQVALQTTQEAGVELSASLRKAAERRTVGAPDVLA
ncbi:hypothetical protein, partial [Salinibacterium sp.]|uniref:hypothetical protein n=1 Tax=Salinibacterium sp. TaxID=1915057 RepID=UPI00286B6023